MLLSPKGRMKVRERQEQGGSILKDTAVRICVTIYNMCSKLRETEEPTLTDGFLKRSIRRIWRGRSELEFTN